MSQRQRFAYRQRQDIIESTLRRKLFFIMGMPKSGTTWLVRMMNAHPEICCWGEGHLSNILYPILENALKTYDKRVNDWHGKFAEIGLEQAPPRFTVNDLYHLFITATGTLFTRALDDPRVTTIGEKTPDNLYSAERLGYLFPNARFIHIIRDGRDACVSGYNMRKAMNEPDFDTKFPTFHAYAENFAQSWSKSVKRGHAFRDKQPDRYAEVTYEALHADASAELAKLFQFLDVPVSDEILKTSVEAGSFKALSKGRERGEESKGSFFRKGIVGDWKNTMEPETQEAFWKHAQEVLTQMGYPHHSA
jgi:hypothetical protein